MEAGSEGEKKKPPEGEKESKTKRKMKTASQLETLEKTYTEDPYPSEAKRAELSVKLGLTDRQLQMWFCHRRLKDRKTPPGAKKPLQNDSPPKTTMVSTRVASEVAEAMIISDARYERELGSGIMPFGHLDSRRVVPRAGMGYSGGFPAMQNYYERHQSLAELRAIAFVEAQLGEPLREDGPVLGMEFDPLPPDAFGAPIGVTTMEHHRQTGRPFEAKIYERIDKGVSRTLHEYQFIPEQPTVRNETHEKVTPPNTYNSLDGIPHSRSSLIFSGRSFFIGGDTAPSGYGIQGQMSWPNILSQHGRHNHVLPLASTENDVPRTNTFIDAAVSTHVGVHPITQIDNSLLSSDRRVVHEEELSRFQRKRKNEEARMQRELEAQEKRIRKELEKQDILRQKREEQIRKEMERRDRERRKEEERLMREKQREDERNQREQRRELERREKVLLKESIRAEKLRQKEELRREKEAARIKAANDRAIARKMAKESMELIEDERLELMELAASMKGFSSILSLDYETLQNLDSYKDAQTSFPPKYVRLKRPFSFQPWLDSEENIGNLLMGWRFLITFADVLGIWPFTLDEFIQAFHDYDPRLLGEIHIALLRSIIKDIEDVARTPSSGAGANQNGSVIPSGGHPQVVEGAYVWGFDIRNWQRHLNPLTWPEILRQFALSAGFGPQLKKSNIEYPSDKNEGIDGEDIVSNLRSGAAVKNAVAVMQQRGLSNPRRSRHRLTPGTVKFAAFHVLSLEGSKGLNILDVADKIQKSGLRDLTTSKTPEASISAALSRDTKLFERTAPSTYCIRPAYRKDPADAEAILSAARERLRIFKSGTVDAEEPDEGERDEDFESDLAEEPEVDDLGTETNAEKDASNFVEFSANAVVIGRKDTGENLQTTDASYDKVNEGLASILAEGLNSVKDISASADLSCENAGQSHDVANANLKGTNVDESHLGEPWVQGLMEGEYSDLSVEERLNALVALIGVAIEGNSIRVVLEERLEAANALKKQMWAEAQLDKRHGKEDYFVKMQSVPSILNKNEPTIAIPSVDGKQSPLPTVEEKDDRTLLIPPVHQEQPNEVQINQNHLQSFPSEMNLQMPEYSAGPDHYTSQQYSAESSRSNLKSYIGHLAEETYMYRFLPLGLDRRRNRYWQFITSQNDPGCGQIFVESHDGRWRLVDSEEDFDALLACLDVRGIRESHLHMMLKRIEMSFKESAGRNILNADLRIPNGDPIKTEAVEMATAQDCSVNSHTVNSSACISDVDMSETSTSFVVQLGRNETDPKDTFRRYQDFEIWMQKECLNCSILCAMKFGKKRCSQFLGICDYCRDVYYSKEIPCPSCHRTFRNYKSNSNSEPMAQSGVKMANDCLFNVSPSSPLRIRLLKVLFSIVEVSIPQEALQPLWTVNYRKSWSTKLLASSSTADLLQILTVLEGSIKREYFASNFETTSELLGSACSSGCPANYSIVAEKIPVLPWVPHTTAAVALRLMELDGSIFYTSQQKLESEKDKRNGDVVKPPSNYTCSRTFRDPSATESILRAEHTTGNWVDLGVGLTSYRRGQRTSGRGRVPSCVGKSQARVIGLRSESRRRVTAPSSRRTGHVREYKRKPQGGGRHRRGQSTRRRQKPEGKVQEISHERDSTKNVMMEDSQGIFVEEFTGGENFGFEMEAASNGSSSERSDYEEDNRGTGEEYDDHLVNNNDDGYDGGFSGKSENNVVEGSDYNVDEEDEDMDDEDGGGDKDRQLDLDAEDYTNGDSDIEENIGDAKQNMDVETTSSSEYSD